MLLSLKKLTRNILPVLFLASALSVQAQDDFVNAEYDWDLQMPTFNIPDSLKEEPQIYFKKHQIVEFGFEGDNFIQLEVLHEIIWVNSDESIDENNKVYVPMGKGTEVVLTKARVINPDGKETLLEKDDVLEVKDEDDNVAHYFALKGIEKGSFLEYFYVIKTSPKYNGRRKVAQELAPVFDYQFDLISPEHLVFDTRSYNGFGDLDEDSFDEEHQHLTKSFEYIPKFTKEDQAYNFPNRMAVVYKLGENTANNNSSIVSYSNVGKNLVSAYSVGTKNDLKTMKKMLKEAAIDPASSEEDKIRGLEYYYKTHFSIFQASAPELEDLAFVYKNKVSNSPGFMKFMALACDQYDIKYQFAMTSNRKNIAFDQKFESYNFLQKYLMYFPGIKKYMDMEEKFSTLGLVDYDYQDNYGVFFNKVVVGEVISATSKIKPVNAPDAEASHSDMDMMVKVADDFSTLEFDLTTSATGYNVSGTQPYFGLIGPDEEVELKETLIKWVDEDMELQEVSADNTGYKHYGVDPLVMKGKFTIDKYIVSVKDKYLIKLGLFIGPQAEMYQEGEARKLPVDMGFRKNYHRVIKFEIPDGYTLTNLETLNMTVEAKEKDGTVYADFISSYTIDGNILTVTCDERYHKIHYPVEQYEDYRKVINAAADFNKIVIYLEEAK
ncbi:DUF3857 domain-containing protein [bacterium SCSIO 12643]|nr:DUF3857 domain-containing protein [bacterium SCSIO 12643]